MALQTGLEGKPWYQGLAIGLALGLAAAAAIYYVAIRPKKEDIARQDARLEDLQQQINQGLAAQANLPQFRDEVRNLELELDKLLRILPARRNTPELIRRIRLLVERGDFDLQRFRPGEPQEREFYSEWPITISLSGSYHNLGLFFDRISRFSRIINIDNLNIGATQSAGSAHTINADFTAKTFIYKETDELSEAPDGSP